MKLILLDSPGDRKALWQKMLTTIDCSAQTSPGDIFRGAVGAGTSIDLVVNGIKKGMGM